MAMSISNQQMHQLKNNLLDDYLKELMTLLQPDFGQWQQSIGEDNFYHALKQGVEDAKTEGFSQRGPVKLYINLQLLLGSGFAIDPQYAGLTEEWQRLKTQHVSQLEQADTLHQELTPYFDQVLGEQNNALLNHLKRLQQLNLNELGVYKETYKPDLHALLYELYPEKYQQLGKETMTQVIIKGTEKAYYQYHFEQPSHSALLVTACFSLGHQFDQDPFLPWFSQTQEHNPINPMHMTTTDMNTNTKAYTQIKAAMNEEFEADNSQQQAKWLEASLKSYADRAMMNYRQK
ncbi:hypothetical protein DM558_05110 [Entomomonas moraniae]|uniref:Uncharacterized protein n=1 Tax=Entomomonas moraniae TaxID=2213226 RepID=A0A3S9XCJ9_9GAMM|nr:hypothetical protein [Entomomonas moraniae]AZS50192.1 hypothetical protein DM558_05110 [Entomomonas moraniae]